MKNHGERKHSKFSASGAERWINCPGSVALSEGVPDKSSVYAEEGTEAHEILEALLLSLLIGMRVRRKKVPPEMLSYARDASEIIFEMHQRNKGSELKVENRINLDFIHPEMFGTLDSAVLDHFGTLHVFDFKYGQGHAVSPTKNLQMIFYGLGLAHHYDYNFKKVRLWIIQPRIKGYDGPSFWEISMVELRQYEKLFRDAVLRVEREPGKYVEGSWCHWCKGKSKCPLKRNRKIEDAKKVFGKIKKEKKK